jgi:peptidoglycan/LPS O-acetylase OafA/YrhL
MKTRISSIEERFIGIDIVKSIACLMVVVLHVFGGGDCPKIKIAIN